MSFFQKAYTVVGLTLSLSLIAVNASASPTNPVAGTDYKILDAPQTTDAGKKVEVTEFFWYSCPHCSALEPSLEEWVAKQGDKIAFKRVPVAFDPRFVPQQKLYYALEAMGKVPELHQKVFNAIHIQRQHLDSDTSIVDYIAKQGLDKAKFLDVYNSFAVQTKATRASQLQTTYKIDGVPTLVVDGRFVTSPSVVGASFGPGSSEAALFKATTQVLDHLVAKVTREKEKPAVATPTKK